VSADVISGVVLLTWFRGAAKLDRHRVSPGLGCRMAGPRPPKTLADQTFSVGEFTLLWDGNDDAGARLPPGLYRAVMTTPDGTICGDIEIR
jgi:hypothetical protein